jgi:PleD family two-component response regulator
MIMRADNCLYKAKKIGKNCIVWFHICIKCITFI